MPQLYENGRIGFDINFEKIIETVVRAIVHSTVVFVFPMLAYRALEHSGNGSVFVFGTLEYMALIMVISVRASYITETWTWINWVLTLVSFSLLFVFIMVWSSPFPLAGVMQPRYYGVGWRCLGSPLCWIVCFSVVLTCLWLDIVYDHIR